MQYRRLVKRCLYKELVFGWLWKVLRSTQIRNKAEFLQKIENFLINIGRLSFGFVIEDVLGWGKETC